MSYVVVSHSDDAVELWDHKSVMDPDTPWIKGTMLLVIGAHELNDGDEVDLIIRKVEPT